MSGKDLGPYCPWYVDDFLGGTTLYGASMIGAYHLLLLHQWAYGYVPRDLTACQTIARCDQATIERILSPDEPERPKFVLHSCGGLINRKMADVRNDRIKFIRDQRAKSAKGVEARRHPKDKPDEQPAGKPPGQPAGKPEGQPPPSSSPSTLPLPKKNLVVSSSSGAYEPLQDDASLMQIIEHLRKNHSAFAKTPEGAIIASLSKCLGAASKSEVVAGVNDLIRHYAGDIDLGLPPNRRLETYILGPLQNRTQPAPTRGRRKSTVEFGTPDKFDD